MRLRDAPLPMMLGAPRAGAGVTGWPGARSVAVTRARRDAPRSPLTPFAFQLACLAAAAMLVGATLA